MRKSQEIKLYDLLNWFPPYLQLNKILQDLNLINKFFDQSFILIFYVYMEYI